MEAYKLTIWNNIDSEITKPESYYLHNIIRVKNKVFEEIEKRKKLTEADKLLITKKIYKWEKTLDFIDICFLDVQILIQTINIE